MKKAFVCLLALMLVLVAFSSCDNQTTTPNPESGSTTTTPEPGTTTPSSGTSTEPPKEATDPQFNAFTTCYRISSIGILSKMAEEDSEVPPVPTVTQNGEVYSFSDFEFINKDDDSVVGRLNGKATITPDKLYLDVEFSYTSGVKITARGIITTSDSEAVFTINGDKCIITNAKILSFGESLGGFIYGSTATP